MEYASLGDSGLKVSRLALGLAFREQLDEGEMERTVARALERGVNFFDTANDYGRSPEEPYGGKSERAFGRAIAGRRDDVVVATKASWEMGPGPNDRGGSRYHIMREIDRSLRRLNMDHVDLYLVHLRDTVTPLEETAGAMIDVVRQGKARYWGVCNYKAWEACKALAIGDRLGGPRLTCVQNSYNMINRVLEREMFPFCREERRGIMAYSPMGIGLLTGFYRPGKPAPPGSVFATARKHLYQSVFNEKAWQILEAVEQIASARGCPPAQVAINWVLARAEITTAIVGCETADQVDANLGAADWKLSDEERETLDRVSHSESLAG